ncbi:hypothetical protein ABZX77_17165, partial [Streptomyces sp. NPDC004237]|uniref:hypothetical protein n=1 Tax=Streptomyces sp. NPDC004237 TaxID=3154455 RepID=UPI0033BDBCF0
GRGHRVDGGGMITTLAPLHRTDPPVARSQGREAAFLLRSLRERCWRSIFEGFDGPAVVALYVLVRPEQDPAGRLAVARAAAARLGFSVADVLVEDAWRTDPGLRPRLARAHALLRQGLVAVSRVDISPDDAPYESDLQRLHSAGAFLCLAHDETRF